MIKILKESTIQKGEEITICWKESGCEPYAYASVEYIGRTRDGKYKFKSTTYGWMFTVDLKNNTVQNHRGKTYEIDDTEDWVKKLPGGVTESIEDEEYDAPITWNELNGTEQMAAEAALDDIKYSGMSIEDAVSHACHTFNDANAESEYDDEDFYGEEADYEAVLSYVKSKVQHENKQYSPKDYNIKEIRRCNVTSDVQKWYDFIMDLGMDTKGIDPMLYAIEFQFRSHNRYGSRKLPKVKDNIFSGYPYYFILPPYGDSNPFNEKWVAENQEKHAKAMMDYLFRTISPDTVMKWQKRDE